MRHGFSVSPASTLWLSLTLLLPVLGVSPARAGWNADGVMISPTATVRLLEACNDGAYGTFVVWQEETAPGVGIVWVQHLLSSGDLDPSWPPEGVVACADQLARDRLLPIRDGLGGVYLLWSENSSAFVKRISPDGFTAAGWPGRGRALGISLEDAIQDGGNGIYIAGRSSGVGIFHLGPNNTGAGGWPNSKRTISPDLGVPSAPFWPRLALAPDGGIFVAWGSYSTDTTVVPSDYRLRRLTSAGLNAADWPEEGLRFFGFSPEHLGDLSCSFLALSSDARGGAFLMLGQVTDESQYYPQGETRLYRFDGDGGPAPGWPTEGKLVTAASSSFYSTGRDGSFRLFPDQADGAVLGFPIFYDHFTDFGFRRCSPTGAINSWPFLEVNLNGNRVVLAPGGALFVSTWWPSGPYGRYDPAAFISLALSPSPAGWSGVGEYHWEPVQHWFDGATIASSGDGGVVFYWAQVRERIGLFARRVTGGGEVTSVEPAERASLSLSGLRFVPGAGVRGSLRIPAGATAHLTLHDLAGRRIAREEFEGGAGEHTLGGTATLSSGLYFARLSAGGETVTDKVFVLR